MNEILDHFFSSLPSSEELERKDEAKMAENLEYLNAHPGAFVGVSLRDWISQAQKSGIAHIPAHCMYTMPRLAILRAEEEIEGDASLWQGFQDALKAVPFTHMVRWDPCAGLAMKMGMANGVNTDFHLNLPEKWNTTRVNLSPDDPRAYDIIYEYPLKDVPIWARPWVPAMLHEGYPIEFRVFVQNSRIIGVANYYIQRALPENEEFMGYAQAAFAAATRLVESMRESGSYPWMPRGFSTENKEIHATLDFLVDLDGNIQFLEAGPPFGCGAHPCAFQNHLDGEGKIVIEGYAMGAVQQ